MFLVVEIKNYDAIDLVHHYVRFSSKFKVDCEQWISTKSQVNKLEGKTADYKIADYQI